jgi:hypothetical protein
VQDGVRLLELAKKAYFLPFANPLICLHLRTRLGKRKRPVEPLPATFVLCGGADGTIFSSDLTGESAEALKDAWSRLEPELLAVLESGTTADLDALHDHPNMGRVQGRAILMRAVTHAREHLGHAQLTRGLWDERR